MKKLKLLLPVLGATSIATAIVPTLASCASGEIKPGTIIEPKVTGDDNVKVTCSEVKAYEQFTATCTVNPGFAIDTVTIKIGNNVLAKNIDYTVKDNVITVDKDCVNNASVKVAVTSKQTGIIPGTIITPEIKKGEHVTEVECTQIIALQEFSITYKLEEGCILDETNIKIGSNLLVKNIDYIIADNKISVINKDAVNDTSIKISISGKQMGIKPGTIITPEIKYGEHVSGDQPTVEALKSFDINCTFDDGYAFDEITIKIGTNTLLKNVDFTISGSKITVKGEVVNDESIKILITAKQGEVEPGTVITPLVYGDEGVDPKCDQIKAFEDFNITCNLKDGYEIDKINIKIGTTFLVEKIDYTITNNVIKVLGAGVNNSSITISITSKTSTKVITPTITTPNGTASCSEITLGKQFTITYAANDGYAMDKVTIVIGTTTLTENTDYIIAGNIITVKGTAVTNETINITITAKESKFVVTLTTPNGSAVYSELSLGKQFTITYSPDEGYEKDKITIKIGGETLIENTHYVVAGNVITVKGEAVQKLAVDITITAKKAVDPYIKDNSYLIDPLYVEAPTNAVTTNIKFGLKTELSEGQALKATVKETDEAGILLDKTYDLGSEYVFGTAFYVPVQYALTYLYESKTANYQITVECYDTETSKTVWTDTYEDLYIKFTAVNAWAGIDYRGYYTDITRMDNYHYSKRMYGTVKNKWIDAKVAEYVGQGMTEEAAKEKAENEWSSDSRVGSQSSMGAYCSTSFPFPIELRNTTGDDYNFHAKVYNVSVSLRGEILEGAEFGLLSDMKHYSGKWLSQGEEYYQWIRQGWNEEKTYYEYDFEKQTVGDVSTDEKKAKAIHDMDITREDDVLYRTSYTINLAFNLPGGRTSTYNGAYASFSLLLWETKDDGTLIWHQNIPGCRVTYFSEEFDQ